MGTIARWTSTSRTDSPRTITPNPTLFTCTTFMFVFVLTLFLSSVSAVQSLGGTKPNANPKTNRNPNTNPIP